MKLTITPSLDSVSADVRIWKKSEEDSNFSLVLSLFLFFILHPSTYVIFIE